MNDIPAGARETLIDMARGAIERQFGMTVHHREQATGELAKWLARPGASFVTLTLDGRLRGCIGTLEAYRPLGQDVRDMRCSPPSTTGASPRCGLPNTPDCTLRCRCCRRPSRWR